MKKKLKKKTILGIDVGVASLGWCLVEINEETPSESKIIDTGVRIVPVLDQVADFSAGRSVAINTKRTQTRGTRRNKYRWKLRREHLKKILSDNNMLPDDTLIKLESDPYHLFDKYTKEIGIDVKKDTKKDGTPPPPSGMMMYYLRKRAVEDKLELPELGRVFLHMLQKRGFKSNRKSNSKEDTDLVSTVNANSKKLEEQEMTPGQYYFERFETYYKNLLERKKHEREKGETIPLIEMPRTKTDRRFTVEVKKKKEGEDEPQPYIQTFRRDTYEKEFEAIWEKQLEFYDKEILSDDLKRDIGARCLFYQRDLKSQKGKVARCQFERGYNVAPKSSPYFMEFRILQNINHLVVNDDEGNYYKLAREENDTEEAELIKRQQRHNLFQFIHQKVGEKNIKGTISRTDTIKTLDYKPIRKFGINFEGVLRDTTRAAWLRIFEAHDLLEAATHPDRGILNVDLCSEDAEQSTVYRLWHLLYSVENPDALRTAIEKLLTKAFKANKHQVSSECVQALARDLEENIAYSPDYGSLSVKAIKKILPHLREGYKYSDACKMVHKAEQAKGRKVNYLHSHYETTEEIETKRKTMNQQKFKPRKLLKRNSVRNPVVEKILNQLIHLLNDVVIEYGRPHEIRVELIRELKRSAKTRQNMDKSMRATKKKHDEIRKRLREEYNYTRVTRNDIIKYKLWEETNGTDIYKNKRIKLSDLFGKKPKVYYEIEHIIPKSRLFDDSFSNKTLSESSFNKQKNNETAHDHMRKSCTDEEYQEYLHRVSQLKNEEKRKKLLMKGEDIPDDFIDRQKRDSQYIAKKTIDILKYYCPKITTTSGAVTDVLRHHWGLTHIMKDLNYDKYKAMDRVRYIDTRSGDRIMQITDWSKREDHRHHAVDALVIACTKQGIIQHLNELNKNYEKREKRQQKAYRFPLPWQNFRHDARQAIDSILISRHAKKSIASKKKNPYHYSKKKPVEERNPPNLTPRAQLHLETVYGEIKLQNEEKIPLNPKFKLEMVEQITPSKVRTAVKKRLAEFDNNPKKAFADLDKNPIYAEGSKRPLTAVDTWRTIYTIRKPLKELSKEQINKIIDQQVKKRVLERLEQHDGDLKKMFSELDKKPIWMNKQAGIKIKSVTIRSHVNKAHALRKNDKGEPIDFVQLSSNHHAAIYRDEKGKYYDEVISKWDAFKLYKNEWERRIELPEGTTKNPIDIIKKDNLKEGHKFVVSLFKGEMLVKDLNPDEIDFFDKKNYSLISKYLYRVQKIACGDYTFRHHLATKIKHKHDEQRISSLKNLESYTKVKINRLGMITDVQKICNNA